MAKVNLTADLERAVDCADIDGVIYHLTQIAVKRRNDATSNRAEERYWQKVLEILHDTLAELEAMTQ